VANEPITAALANWTALNTALRTATEDECAALLRQERKAGNRIQYLLRIHGRYNRLRSDRERREILQGK
jgi:hypothetical protein